MPVLTCPACGSTPAEGATECPGCHLAVELFDAVRDAAGGNPEDPNYVKAIGDLLSAVELSAAASAPAQQPAGIMSRPPRVAPVSPAPKPATPAPSRPVPEVDSSVPLPALPEKHALSALKQQVDDYLMLARRAGVTTKGFSERAATAMMTDDVPSLEALARDLFVHLSARMTEEYQAILARRNEIAQLIPTPSADVELQSSKAALARGDLAGASRRLRHVTEELSRLEQEWEVVQILTTENDLLAETVRELGGDPTPALGPLVAGRAMVAEGRRNDAEQMLARGTLALWSVLQPPLVKELHRMKERIVERKDSGDEVEPALEQMRALLIELKKRNFVGTIVAYRRLRVLIGGTDDALAGGPAIPEAVGVRAPPHS